MLQNAHDRTQGNAGSLGIKPRFALRIDKRALARLVFERPRIINREGDAVDLVGAFADHLVKDLAHRVELANDDGDLIGYIVTDDAGRLLVLIVIMIGGIDAEIGGLYVLWRDACLLEMSDDFRHRVIVLLQRLLGRGRALQYTDGDDADVGPGL